MLDDTSSIKPVCVCMLSFRYIFFIYSFYLCFISSLTFACREDLIYFVAILSHSRCSNNGLTIMLIQGLALYSPLT